MKQVGFTVVELLITIVILVMLLTLGTVGLRGIQANGRDAERKADIDTIAISLEQRYKRGNNTNLSLYAPGTYPGTNELWNGPYYSGQSSWQDVFTGVSAQAIKSPSNQGLDATCLLYFYSMPKCDKAEKDLVIQEQFSNGSGGWKDMYLYEYIGPSDGYCNYNECVRYNLYWISEVDKTVYKGIPGLKVKQSKHQ